MKKLVPQAIKNIYHLFCAMVANVWFGFPSRKIKVIGITGTNGKTTTTQMVTRILEKAGHQVAMASTINFKLATKEWVNATKFTTLSAWQVQKFLRQAVRVGCDYIVLETSSHSLDQYRVWGIDYEVAVVTNVTREHLDYHQTMQKYRQAKKKLFQKAKVAVVNLEMENPKEFLAVSASEKYSYCTMQNAIFQPGTEAKKSEKECKIVQADNIEINLEGTRFIINGITFNLKLIGRFNVENALAAICVGLSQGVSLKTAKQALESIEKVPGRMDYVANNRGLNIIIDYALTPDSMEKLGQLVQGMKIVDCHKQPKVIWVFGSCGDRDRGKRPMMGEIVSRYADYLIVTNEDPYTEDPWRIINEVFSGVTKTENEFAWKIMDRKEAIKKALGLAQKGDILLVTGKGAEEMMLVGKKRIPWNDRQVVEEILQEKQ